MKVDIDYQSNPLPNRPSSQDKHLWQKKQKAMMGFPLINYGSVPGTVTTWKAYKESPEENCLLCPSSHSSGWEIWQCESEIDPMSLALAKIGTGKAGPHSSGKGQRISTVRDFRFFLMPWRDKSKSFTCHPASHWSQRVPIFSVWFYITRKNKVCVYTAGGNRPLPSHFLDQCFLCIVANKKIMDGCFSYQNEAQS